MDSRRACIHEAGHFYLAFKYRPSRAHSIRSSRQSRTDSSTGEPYDSLGETCTVDPPDGQPQIIVSIRAAGLAAESLVYNESYEDLMGNATIRFRIKTDTDHAKRDLEKAELMFPSSTDEQFLFFWRIGFDNAVIMMSSSQDKLHCIADYLLANPDREILRAELVEKCDL
jgi:hypothetical protein